MKKYLALMFNLSAAACGDNLDAPPDAAVTPGPDAAPDAQVCDVAAGYPTAIRPITVDLGDQFPLALDGQGTRCEQIIRAVTDPDPTKRPPELAELDLTGIVSTCSHEADIDRDVVRLRATKFAGLTLFAPVQDVVIHVASHPTLLGMPGTVVFLHGDFLPVSQAAQVLVPDACFDASRIGASVPGRQLSYARFDGCQYQGDGSYGIANDDVVETGEEGLLVDRDGKLHRVRAVDVYLAASHVTAAIAQTDLFCCNGETLDHCAGERLYIDVLTGEAISTEQHCHTCLAP